MSFLTGPVMDYLGDLAAMGHQDPVLDDMEARAAENGFPIVGRAVGRFLEVAARSIGARRVCELGSGYGYSAYWFAGAVGSDGEVVATDGDPDNCRLAESYLRRAGRWSPVNWQVGDALEGLAATDGDFDVVYCDVDKDGYPDCWRAAAERIRVGGLYLCDNVLWDGLVLTGEDRDEATAGFTAAVREHNRLVAADRRYVSTIVPLRDGVTMAVRVA
jgi:predicted O-methyltransferase YrrM